MGKGKCEYAHVWRCSEDRNFKKKNSKKELNNKCVDSDTSKRSPSNNEQKVL